MGRCNAPPTEEARGRAQARRERRERTERGGRGPTPTAKGCGGADRERPRINCAGEAAQRAATLQVLGWGKHA